MKIKVMRHKDMTWRNIEGKVVNIVYEYTIAVRRFGVWRHLRLYPSCLESCLCTEQVVFSYEGTRHATKFNNESDAIRLKLDILQHPDKYIKSL